MAMMQMSLTRVLRCLRHPAFQWIAGLLFPHAILCLGEAYDRITGSYCSASRETVGLILLLGLMTSAIGIFRWRTLTVGDRLLLLAATIPLTVACCVGTFFLIVYTVGFAAP
jgi:hypothetical protein